MEFKILSEEERRILRSVDTTPEQAQQIKERNQAGLDYMVKFPWQWNKIAKVRDEGLLAVGLQRLKIIRIGCPHCDENYPCSVCSWQEIAVNYAKEVKSANIHANEDGKYIAWICCAMRFGGINCYDIKNHHYIHITLGWQDMNIMVVSLPPYAEYAKYYRIELVTCRKFLGGHIEFADGKLTGEL